MASLDCPPTIRTVLASRAFSAPKKCAFSFLDENPDGSIHREEITYDQLHQSVTALATRLSRPEFFQERAILFFQPGLAYIQAFFACLHSGMVAVPCYPPQSSRKNARNLERLLAIVDDARPRVALTDARLYARIETLFPSYPILAQLEWVIVDALAPLEDLSAELPAVEDEHLAFLQYTSGSTSAPKGVMVTHGNLISNEVMIQQAFGTDETTTCVGWLPLYHDMGLIGNVIQPLFAGFTCHLMAPSTFLRKPLLWLETISAQKAVVSGGPNFAYELCCQKISDEQAAALDLTSWRVAFNGSEPLRPSTLNTFSKRFAAAGFQASSHFPCYGLAEATLMVSARGECLTMRRFDEAALGEDRAEGVLGDSKGRVLASSGVLCASEKVSIVNPHNHQVLADNKIGEIWVQGPHVAAGYWQRPDLTHEIFAAYTAEGAGPFMRTGDLGFFSNDELYITGRLKELIILRGRNHYPQDIELTVQTCDPGLQRDSCAAFCLEEEGEERLVVLQEVKRTAMRTMDASATIRKIREAVADAHEVHLHAVVLIKPATLPKTTSGKVRRKEACRLYEQDLLDVVETHSFHLNERTDTPVLSVPQPVNFMAASEAERLQLLPDYLQHLLAKILRIGVSQVAMDQSINSFGLDSLAAMELVGHLQSDLGINYPLEDVLDGPTPTELALALSRMPINHGEANNDTAAQADGQLSINQSALWLLHQLHPESSAYLIPVALRLNDKIDLVQLKGAMSVILQRHPSLRTVFYQQDGEPRQRVLSNMEPVCLEINAQSWDEVRLRAELQKYTSLPFDLRQPPWRMVLFQNTGGQQVLLLVVHHIIADLWSLLIFFRELGALCQKPNSLGAPPATSYAHFVARQKRYLASQAGEKDWAYWQQNMSGNPAILSLPTDKPRPAVQTYHGDAFDFQLGPDLSLKLRAWAANQDATSFMVLLAVWQVLLHRYSGQDDVCVGSPTAGRVASNFNSVIGDFVNPVTFRGDLSGNPTFLGYFSQVIACVRGGLAHGEFPLELVVERVCPRRDPSFSPLFQSMFSLQKTHGLEEAAAFILADRLIQLQLGGLNLSPIPLPVRAAQVDLSLVVADDAQLPARIVFNSDLFSQASAARFADHFRNLLEQVLCTPHCAIGQLELMGASERSLMLETWNQTEVAFDRESTLHGLFEASAAHYPLKPALTFGHENHQHHQLSYAELNRRANVLAHYLRHLGVGMESRVGICLHRHPSLVVALLAVLKANAAYVPLDPNHPTERTAQILADSGMHLLITEHELKRSFQDTGVTLLSLDELPEEMPDHNLELKGDVQQLAYVIYTSGSTGRPKGVQLCHYGVVNFLQSMKTRPGINEDDVLLAITTISFDIAGLELYLPLLYGARLVLASTDEVTDGAALVANLVRNQVTIMQATPSTWRLLLDAHYRGPLKALCGGEALPGKLARDLLVAGVELWNMYGPTETTIWSAVRAVAGAADTTVEPVGFPIANTGMYVCNQHGMVLPINVAGELYLSGDGLARGYYARPSLTAANFVPNGFTTEGNPGSRIYRTGDLVRRLANGTLDFLGRIDHQVKLRGFRIEIGEIEAALLRHPDIREAAVALTGSNEENRRLTAWLTLLPHSELDAKQKDTLALAASLREYLRASLPDYMLPSVFRVLDAMPLTPNNKVDRRALPQPPLAVSATTLDSPRTAPGLEATIAKIWCELLELPQVGPNDNFFDLGGHSMLMSRVNYRLKEQLKLSLTMVEMFQFTTVSSLAAHIQAKGKDVTQPEHQRKQGADPDSPIAIVGMACRFPGAADVGAFWYNLYNGISALVTYSDETLRESGVSDELIDHPNYVKVGAFLDDAQMFDAHFFDFTPLDASLIDPQQRVFLEICWIALEQAGYNPQAYTGAIGVFAGAGMNTYLPNNLLSNPALAQDEGEYRLMTTNDKDFMATRVAYKLNLTGPALNVQTACSTSLVAVHLGCQSLRQGESDMVLAGGATIRVPGNVGYLYRDGLVFSPDGTCRAFDKNAGGTVPGSGAGVVLLKRLAEAQADGDDIVAVIKGSAINNDASQKVGFTAPGVNGQRDVILMAQAAADVAPETITYVEAHGTGTRMGDPIEIAALSAAFGRGTARTGYCALGSVKTNIGHLDAAAGVAGLIKTALALKHATLPASLNFSEANPEIGFESTPFYVNPSTKPWPAADTHPRRAAISSFGIGGTNAHAILEEAPARLHPIPTAEDAGVLRLLLLSARSAPSLEAASRNLAEFLEARGAAPLLPVAAQLATRRKLFEHRRFVVCDGGLDGAQALASLDPQRVFSRRDVQLNRGVVFMFPGQGAQYPAMTASLYREEALFKTLVDHCCTVLEPLVGLDLRLLLYPTAEKMALAAEQLSLTQYTQPALFVVEYAAAKLLQSWGILPRALIGHSVGEYVAATLAGVFTLADALSLVAHRGQLIASLPKGAMLSVPLSEANLKPHLNDELALAAVNAPAMCVVSGTDDVVEALASKLERAGTATRRLNTSHAFHSHMMDPILESFEKIVAQMELAAPTLQMISNLTGKWLTDEQAQDPAYWRQHLRGAVRFADGVETLSAEADAVLLEVGPGRALTSLARRHPKREANQVLLNLLPPAEQHDSERRFLLETLGKLWMTGVAINWSNVGEQTAREHMNLPGYPFERKRFWIEPGVGATQVVKAVKSQDVGDWFYVPSWKRTLLAATPIPKQEATCWLLLTEKQGPSRALTELLRTHGHQVIVVARGERFIRVAEDSYTINTTRPEEYGELMAVLGGSGRNPKQIVHFGNHTSQDAAGDGTNLAACFYELLWLARALAANPNNKYNLTVISNGMQDVVGEGLAHPLKAMVRGVLKVIPQEHDSISCRSVDFDFKGTDETRAQQIYEEICLNRDDSQVAYRGRTRWTQVLEPIRLESAQPWRLKQQGTYLITGGLGGIGLTIAGYLAENFAAKLVLLGRSAPAADKALPAELSALEARGAQILAIAADVADESSLRAAVATARTRFGHINGVIHAAGLPGGGALLHREVAEMEKVFAPKIKGTFMLERVLSDDPPEFMTLFSSVNGILGGFGQSDYAAANTFLDAFAHARQDGPTHVSSINWDSWRQVGMAALALEQATGKAVGKTPKGSAVAYPLFDMKLAVEGNKATYLGSLDVNQHWPLNEHWILDRAILPGTTYLEMARAALEDHTGQATVTFRDVAFLAPLVVPQGSRIQTRTVLERRSGFFRFIIASFQDDGQWHEHASGELHPNTEEPRTYDGDALAELHTLGHHTDPLGAERLGAFHIKSETRSLGDRGDVSLRVVTDGKQPPEVSIELGPRWHTARWVKIAENSGLALLELEAAYGGDLQHYKLHPALLDFAVGYLRLFKNQAHYLPLSYKRLTLFKPLSARLYSYIKFADSYNADRGTPIFDIILFDEQGAELVRIEGFALGRIDGARLQAGEQAARAKAAERAAFTRNWMSPSEGLDAFQRALSSVLPQVIVSTRDINTRLQESVSQDMPGSLHGKGFDRPVHPRPDLMNAFVAPRDEQEAKLAKIWQDVIGLEQVGIHDDFNDLGGDSLLITRIHGQMKEEMGAEISVAELMQYPNIADISAYMRKQAGPREDVATEVQGVRRERHTQARKTQSKLKQARRNNPLSRSGK